jgi:hypothetical protein
MFETGAGLQSTGAWRVFVRGMQKTEQTVTACYTGIDSVALCYIGIDYKV